MKFAIVMLLVVSASAHAGGIVFEHHAGARQPVHEAALQRLLEELERGRELVARPTAVGALLGIAVAAPVVAGAARDPRIEVGVRAYLDGRYDQAIAPLAAAIADAHAHPQVLVAHAKARSAVRDALIALALSYQRRDSGGDRAHALETMHELIRSYQDQISLRAEYGPDAEALFREALAVLQARGTGRLAINSDDSALPIYIDERVRPLDIALPPGTYRVLAGNRRFEVTVEPGGTTLLPLRTGASSAFTVSERWVGFAGVPRRVAVEYARELVGPLQQDVIVLVGEQLWQGAPALMATVFDKDDPSVARTYLALLDARAEARVVALARVVRGVAASDPLVIDADASAAVSVPVPSQLDEETEATSPRPAPTAATRSTHYVLAGGLGVVGVIGGALALRFAGEASDAAQRLDTVCAVRCSQVQAEALVEANHGARRNAFVAGSVSALAFAGGAALLWYARQPHLTVTPRSDGATVSYSGRF